MMEMKMKKKKKKKLQKKNQLVQEGKEWVGSKERKDCIQ